MSKPSARTVAKKLAPSCVDEKVIEIDLWHVRLHRVTGAMAIRCRRATANDLAEWAAELAAIAAEMLKASAPSDAADRTAPSDTDGAANGRASP